MSKGGETRQRIVAEAAALFNQRGFEGCSMSELMKATGLEKGGIYRHFSSKEELAAEAFDYAWKNALKARRSGLDAIPNAVDRLKQSITNFVERRGPVPGGCPLLNTAIDADDGNPLLRERAREAFRGLRDSFVSIVKRGLKAKEIRPNVNPREVATLVISSLEGALMISRLEGNMNALVAAQSHLHRYLKSEVRRGPRSLRNSAK